jgi:hypothetical protein
MSGTKRPKAEKEKMNTKTYPPEIQEAYDAWKLDPSDINALKVHQVIRNDVADKLDALFRKNVGLERLFTT